MSIPEESVETTEQPDVVMADALVVNDQDDGSSKASRHF